MPPAAFLHWGSLQRSPRSLAGLRRPTSKGGEAKGEEGREWEGRAGKGRGKGGTLDSHNVGERLTPLPVRMLT